MRDLDSVQSAVAEVEQRYGPITFAVNAAGTGVGTGVGSPPPRTW
ncbi:MULTISPECIES: hypothetical protein [Amycolatopsis]|nr:hypothetical protein [Amycolatopsis tucumanensis]